MSRPAAKSAATAEVRDRKGRWRPGQSGNPKGPPKADPVVKEIAMLLTRARYAGATVTISFAQVAEVAVR